MVLFHAVLAHDALLALREHGHQDACVLQRIHHLGQRGLAAREADENLGEARIGAAVVIGKHRLRNLLERF